MATNLNNVKPVVDAIAGGTKFRARVVQEMTSNSEFRIPGNDTWTRDLAVVPGLFNCREEAEVAARLALQDVLYVRFSTRQ